MVQSTESSSSSVDSFILISFLWAYEVSWSSFTRFAERLLEQDLVDIAQKRRQVYAGLLSDCPANSDKLYFLTFMLLF